MNFGPICECCNGTEECCHCDSDCETGRARIAYGRDPTDCRPLPASCAKHLVPNCQECWPSDGTQMPVAP